MPENCEIGPLNFIAPRNLYLQGEEFEFRFSPDPGSMEKVRFLLLAPSPSPLTDPVSQMSAIRQNRKHSSQDTSHFRTQA
jgi:hypothetical protein